MRSLDETDLAIIQLLRADARRPFSDIADAVNLSPPAVSDRIDRLQELGIIERFTVELDRAMLHHGQPMLLTVTPDPQASGHLFETLAELDEVADAFRLTDGRIHLHVHLQSADVADWLGQQIDTSTINALEVSPLVESHDNTAIQPSAFDLSCVVCGNEVGADGELARFDGAIKPFCCESCLSRYEAEYEELQDRATGD